MLADQQFLCLDQLAAHFTAHWPVHDVLLLHIGSHVQSDALAVSFTYLIYFLDLNNLIF